MQDKPLQKELLKEKKSNIFRVRIKKEIINKEDNSKMRMFKMKRFKFLQKLLKSNLHKKKPKSKPQSKAHRKNITPQLRNPLKKKKSLSPKPIHLKRMRKCPHEGQRSLKGMFNCLEMYLKKIKIKTHKEKYNHHFNLGKSKTKINSKKNSSNPNNSNNYLKIIINPAITNKQTSNQNKWYTHNRISIPPKTNTSKSLIFL